MKFFLKTKRFKTISILALGAILFFSSLSYYSGQIRPEVTQADESFRARMAVYFKLFFIDRDFNDPLWQRWDVRVAPPGSAYIAGLALWLGGEQDKIGKMGLDDWWNFKESFAWNLLNIELPSAKELYILKFTMALFVSFSCVAVYWICLKCFGIITAFFSFFLFAFHPLIIECATNATFDAPLIFFIILNILLTLFFYENFSKEKYYLSLLFAAIIGLNTAVTSVVKIQGAITGVIFLVFCFCIMAIEIVKLFKRNASRSRDKASWINKIRVVLIGMTLFGLGAVTFFILPNPCFYRQPMAGFKKMAELRTEQIKKQIKEFSTKNYFHNDYSAKIIASFPQKVHFVISESLSTKCGHGLLFQVKFLLLILGFFLMVYSEIRFFRKNLRFSLSFIILLWFVVLFAAIIAVIYICFAKYCLTLIAPVSVLMAYALDRTIRESCKRANGISALFLP